MNTLDGVYNEQAMQEKKVRDGNSLDMEIDKICKKIWNKYPDCDGILHNHQRMLDYFNNLVYAREEDFHYISFEDEGLPREFKILSQEELDEIDRERAKIRKIKHTPTLLDIELKEFPDLLQNEDMSKKITKPFQKRNQAQLINTFEWTNKYGKVVNSIAGSTKTGYNISRIPAKSFGSLADYNIDTIPLSNIKCKGTEITYVTNRYLRHEEKQLMSRRTISEALSYWCYLLGIDYIPDEGKPSGIKIWCRPLDFWRKDGKSKFTELFLNGEDLELIIRDIIFLSRNKPINKDKVTNLISSGKLSPHLYNTIEYLRKKGKTSFQNILNDIKGRVFYDHISKDGQVMWNYPKYNISDLTKYLKELNSGNYYKEILIPIIKDLQTYPIECKDTKVFPKSDAQHKQNRDDYDITQHIWERD